MYKTSVAIKMMRRGFLTAFCTMPLEVNLNHPQSFRRQAPFCLLSCLEMDGKNFLFYLPN